MMIVVVAMGVMLMFSKGNSGVIVSRMARLGTLVKQFSLNGSSNVSIETVPSLWLQRTDQSALTGLTTPWPSINNGS